jgi:hypothetical protein
MTLLHSVCRSKTAVRFLAALLFLAGTAALAQDEPQVAKAEAAAQTWLALADSGDYAQNWDQSSSLFQASISKAMWAGALGNARQPLGKVMSRKVKTAVFKRSLPGAPDGEYVVIQYATQFEHHTATETVTPMLDKDGSWRVSGYFIN